MRALSREAFERLDLQTTGMEFASEMVIKARLVGLRIAEVPTTLDKAGRSRGPHLRPWRDAWRHIRFMLLYCPRWLFLYPGVGLILAGAMLGAVVLGHALTRASQMTDAHVLLLAAAAVLLGFQGVAFAFCARIYALNEGLLPEDATLERMFRYFTLETGLAAGAILLVLGVAGGAYVANSWTQAGASIRDPQETLLVAIPAAAALCLGGQVVFISFLLSFLGLRRR
jgi:hypothetical protein